MSCLTWLIILILWYDQYNKSKEITLLKNVCDTYGITEEKIKQYATIINFKKR